MAYEIVINGGQMVDDASKVLDNEETVVQGVLNTETTPELASFDKEVLKGAAGEEEVDESYWDRFKTSKVKTWDPKTKTVIEEEIPTWERAAKGVATGLKAYGLTLLKTGGDESQAWGAGLETAFGSLESEKAAATKATEWNKQVTELVKDGKYTPSSIKAFAESGGDYNKLIQKEQVLTAAQKLQDEQFGKTHQLATKAQTETERANLVNESIARLNAESTRLNAQYSIQEVEIDGKKYIQQWDKRTQSVVGKPVLKDSAEATKLLKAKDEELKVQDTFLQGVDTNLAELDHYLADDGKDGGLVYEATEGYGGADYLGNKLNIKNTEAHKDRGNINKYVIGEALESLAAFKGATTDFEYLKAEAKNVNFDSAADVTRFLKKVRLATVTAKADAKGFKLGGDTKRKPPVVNGKPMASGSMFESNGKQYVVVGDTTYLLGAQPK